jgi:hypothetical protein
MGLSACVPCQNQSPLYLLSMDGIHTSTCAAVVKALFRNFPSFDSQDFLQIRKQNFKY